MNVQSNPPIPFPSTLPEGYRYMEETVTYDAKKHLALQYPEQTWTLRDLGYSEEEVAVCPTPFAMSSVARLLSDEGAIALANTARALRRYATSCERIDNMVRGGAYLSRFLRDLCLCPKVTGFMSDIYGIAVAPHTMPLQLGHINFAPDDLSKAVDKWHHDTLALDYVMLASDPRTLSGGEFQYFLGTKREAAALAARKALIPADRTVSPVFPAAGCIVVMQGNMVVHRGAKLTAPGERITMVNGYVPLDAGIPDACSFPDLKRVDPHHVLFTEWARHKAWLSREKLNKLLHQLPFTDDKAEIIAALRAAIDDVETAIADIGDEGDGRMTHYGG